MNQKTVFFVGKPFNDFARWLAKQGYQVGIFKDSHAHRPLDEKIFNFIIETDFTNQQSLISSLNDLPVNPDCLIAIYENYIVPKVIISEHFNLPTITLESAKLATDKYLMRQAFKNYDQRITPQFTQVTTKEELLEFAHHNSFPLILKPANLFKSLLVTKNDTLEELLQNWEIGQKTIKKIYKQEGVTRDPSFVVEEFMQGPVVSVEAFADQDGEVAVAPNVVDLIMGRDIGVSDNYNYSRKLPSTLSPSTQQAVHEVAIQGVKALRLTSSPAHVEMIITNEGPKIIEIGARTGGYRPRMYELAMGVDLYQAQIDAGTGVLPDMKVEKNHYCAVYEIFPNKDGLFKELAGLEELKALPSQIYLSVKRNKGEQVGLAKNGFRAVAVVVLASEDKNQLAKDASFVEKQVKVELQ